MIPFRIINNKYYERESKTVAGRGKKERSRPMVLGRERNVRFVVPPKFKGRKDPSFVVLLLRGECRGCFHPRSAAVLHLETAERSQRVRPSL